MVSNFKAPTALSTSTVAGPKGLAATTKSADFQRL